ncbi:hypothetical protein KQH56_00410 [bacterium]|nr:hypothetical protein [bacterium]
MKISKKDPVVHLKAYGGLKVSGVDQVEVQCEIEAPQLATLVEEDGHVYLTANAACSVSVPKESRIEIEKGMGSVSISDINNEIRIEKAFGNLVLLNIADAKVEKVGGNFSVKNATGAVSAEKVGGNLVGENIGNFNCEKVGGNCVLKEMHGDLTIGKVGGSFKGQSLQGKTSVYRVGGNFKANEVLLSEDIKAGGEIYLTGFDMTDSLDLHAGGDIKLVVAESFPGAHLDIRSGARKIKIQSNKDEISVSEKEYEYQLGNARRELMLVAGADVIVETTSDLNVEIVGDISPNFAYEESAFSELIQERVESATRRAEAKVKAAEVRLEKIQEQVDKHRGFNLKIDIEDDEVPLPSPPMPQATRQAGRKGASDEERLMILKMLQDKQISVEEAETLFKALEK